MTTPAPGRARGPRRRPGSRRSDWWLWVGTRLLLVAIILDWIPWAEQVNDLRIYDDWATGALAEGRFPTDQMWQYPPLAAPILLLGSLLPGQRLGFVLVFLVFDVAVMAMVAARSRGPVGASGRRLWALVPVVVGPLLLARFDVVPTALAVAALVMVGRPAASGALAALGALVKVWPALVVAGLPRRHLPRAVGGAVATSALALAVLGLVMDDPLSFLSGQRDRGLQIESVAALPYLVAGMLGSPVSVVYRFGAHEVEAPGAQVVAAACTLASVGLLALVAVRRLRGRLEHLPAADVALVAVLFSVVTSRVFSGQYFIWLLGLGALALTDPATRVRPTIRLLVAAGIATHLVYPWLYTALLDLSPLAVLVQAIRVALTVAAAASALRLMLAPPPQASGSRPSSMALRRSAERSHPQDDSTH